MQDLDWICDYDLSVLKWSLKDVQFLKIANYVSSHVQQQKHLQQQKQRDEEEKQQQKQRDGLIN